MKALLQKFREHAFGAPEKELSTLGPVLVAEDDPIFHHVLVSWLRKWGYQVTDVSNGMDAWNLLQQQSAPKLAILDWMMPGMDGIELCQKIRKCEEGPYRYVLLLTARDNKQDVVTGLEAGADDYLTKPFDVDELRARVRSGQRILELQDALVQTHTALQFEATHDHLTGLWNRSAIFDTLEREFQRGRRAGGSLGIVMLDLDHFKTINDTYGHLTGDAVLREVAQRLAASIRSYDSAGRYGGEEFLVIVPGCAPADLFSSAERLRRCIGERPFKTDTGLVAISISLGIASVELDSHSCTDYGSLIRAADEGLYAAKAGGRNRVEVAAPLPA